MINFLNAFIILKVEESIQYVINQACSRGWEVIFSFLPFFGHTKHII